MENGGARSTDGGRTWTFSISSRAYGLVTEVLRTPGSPDILYAATWCANGCTQGAARVLKSSDGGVTWSGRSRGLPVDAEDPFTERLSLAMSPSDPRVLYAATSLPNPDGLLLAHVYKTTDGGENWTDLPSVTNHPDGNVAAYFNRQSWYDNALVVAPGDPDTVLAGGVLAIRTTDGGATWRANLQPDFHVDQHDFQYQGSTLWVANDGGIFVSADRGASMTSRNDGLVTRQYYALSNDLAHRNRIVAGSQDNGTGQRPDAGGDEWRNILGADGFECAASPQAPNLLYATVQNGGSSGRGTPERRRSHSPGSHRPTTPARRAPSARSSPSRRERRRRSTPDPGGSGVRRTPATRGCPCPRSRRPVRRGIPFESVSAIRGRSLRAERRLGRGGPLGVPIVGRGPHLAGRLRGSARSSRERARGGLGRSERRLRGDRDDGRSGPVSDNGRRRALGGAGIGIARLLRGDRRPRGSDRPGRPLLWNGCGRFSLGRSRRQLVAVRNEACRPSPCTTSRSPRTDRSRASRLTAGECGSSRFRPPATGRRSRRSSLRALRSGAPSERPSSSPDGCPTRMPATPSPGHGLSPTPWETVRVGRGETAILHTFRRAGIFPVSLTAVDGSGATASTFVTVTVPETFRRLRAAPVPAGRRPASGDGLRQQRVGDPAAGRSGSGLSRFRRRRRLRVRVARIHSCFDRLLRGLHLRNDGGHRADRLHRVGLRSARSRREWMQRRHSSHRRNGLRANLLPRDSVRRGRSGPSDSS
jgi:photosystem II stability/assembly factor-like uncharacterized protein